MDSAVSEPICFYRPFCLFPVDQVMCLAIPALVKSIVGEKAQVDFGQGVLREVNVSLVDAQVGDYVLVHAGYAIQKLDQKDALETLSLWREVLAMDEQQ